MPALLRRTAALAAQAADREAALRQLDRNRGTDAAVGPRDGDDAVLLDHVSGP
jgi:hypothetical protein